eukprot:TRINITY_DN18289_c0_g2_i2.p1 TRINITY_DN18289_c0_g2~~TRINITY_DN18289_c0_g2_i2.p1  ORF type:complete len:585 (+),score=156.28 TRINITY_DN18289_c0_g2_i2:272-2026(+)
MQPQDQCRSAAGSRTEKLEAGAQRGAEGRRAVEAGRGEVQHQSEGRIRELEGAVRLAVQEAQGAAEEVAGLAAALQEERARSEAARMQLCAQIDAISTEKRLAAEAAADSLAAALRAGQASRDEVRQLQAERNEERIERLRELNNERADHERTRAKCQDLQIAVLKLTTETVQLRTAADADRVELNSRYQKLLDFIDKYTDSRRKLSEAREQTATVRGGLTAARADLADERERRLAVEGALEAERAAGARAREELGGLQADIGDLLELGQPLGSGGFGEVYAAELPLVVKRAHPGGEDELRHEAEVLSALRRADPANTAGIVRMFGNGCFAPPIDGLILERARGDLDNVRPVRLVDVQDCARDLLQGLLCLEQNGIVHRDIKEGNLLVNNRGVVVLADLGLSQRAGTLAEGGWTPGWQPPEALLVAGMRDTQPAEDWWAAAVVITGLVYEEHPLRSAVLGPGQDYIEEARHLLRRSEEFAGETVAQAAPHLIQPPTQADFFDNMNRVIDPERRYPLQGIAAGRWLTAAEWDEVWDGTWDSAQRLPPVRRPRDIADPKLRRVVVGMARLNASDRMGPRQALAELA